MSYYDGKNKQDSLKIVQIVYTAWILLAIASVIYISASSILTRL